MSLRVANAYADVTSTVVQLETANTVGYLLGIADSQLALQSGRIFQVAGGYSGAPTSFTIYEPVPPRDFAPLLHFVATARFSLPVSFGMNSPTLPPAPPWLKDLGRIVLSVPFALAPWRSGGYTYHQAPVVKQGIGVQVQTLQFSGPIPPSMDLPAERASSWSSAAYLPTWSCSRSFACNPRTQLAAGQREIMAPGSWSFLSQG